MRGLLLSGLGRSDTLMGLSGRPGLPVFHDLFVPSEKMSSAEPRPPIELRGGVARDASCEAPVPEGHLGVGDFHLEATARGKPGGTALGDGLRNFTP